MAHSSTRRPPRQRKNWRAAGHEAFLIGDYIGLCVGLKLDMQFNDDVRMYKGTVTKVTQLRHKTVYVCEYDDADTVQHTEEELRIALRGESVISARL
jgi:hypothetical protein